MFNKRGVKFFINLGMVSACALMVALLTGIKTPLETVALMAFIVSWVQMGG